MALTDFDCFCEIAALDTVWHEKERVWGEFEPDEAVCEHTPPNRPTTTPGSTAVYLCQISVYRISSQRQYPAVYMSQISDSRMRP